MLSPTYLRSVPAVFPPNFECPTNRGILINSWSWLGISIFVRAVYSTVFSGIFLGIAMVKPRWGQSIGTNGHISFSTATLLSALFSKTIELSFVTVFVACLGQILSRRAFRKKIWNGGISIAEMSMRTWVMQPGTLITHWQAVGYAAATYLGATVLIAAVLATFYTTAAEALVSLKLKFGPVQDRVLQGQVTASFANADYLAQTCTTPISASMDPIKEQHACQSGTQDRVSVIISLLWMAGLTTSQLVTRATINMWDVVHLSPTCLTILPLWVNASVRFIDFSPGQWITPSRENITSDSDEHRRFVQNVTMAMPRAGVFHAVRDPMNNILQPEDRQGSGEYVVEASVPAPTLNIFCVGVTTPELAPLMNRRSGYPVYPAYPNKTSCDDLFSFSPKFNLTRQRAPLFAKYQQPYNTIINASDYYGNNGIYLLAAPATPLDTQTCPFDYLFCSIQTTQYSNCTTRCHAAESGGQLSVHCDNDRENTIPYLESEPLAPLSVWNKDWKDVGSQWALALALNDGISNSNASISRLLVQIIPPSNELVAALPSIGESLGVLGGCTMLVSSQDAPFIHYWNYSETNLILADPQYQYFNASSMN